MRWPLRNQIMAPMAGVMLAVIVGLSLLNAYLSARRTQQQVEAQLRSVCRTLAESRFPLTDTVLRQMHGLSGAEYVLLDAVGQVTSASDPSVSAVPLAELGSPQRWQELTLGTPVPVAGETFFPTLVGLPHRDAQPDAASLCILYPERSYAIALRHAVFPPLIVGGAALGLMVLLAIWIAARVSRPLTRFQQQVEHIARGDFQPLPEADRDDELRDLGHSINQMAQMLSRYEGEVRRREQLRTLDQLGGGIAHQLRNAVTGCRMAVDLHRRECHAVVSGGAGQVGSEPQPTETLDVAVQQLKLMEKYLQRFLALGRSQQRPHRPVELSGLVESVLPLVGPMARHLGVELKWQPPAEPLTTQGDADALEQLLINLLTNAIEAVAEGQRGQGPVGQEGRGEAASGQRLVAVRLVRVRAEAVSLEVHDSGPGPAAAVRDRLFEPFVTEKADGTGLGLPVARAIAEQHGGQLRWDRRDGMTCFAVELPLTESATTEASRE